MKRQLNHRTAVFALVCTVLGLLGPNSLRSQLTILTEDFENNCNQGCLADTYGSWSVTSTGTEGSCPNTFFISCAENGNAAGACGSGCGNDESLHIANQSCSPWSPVFCPTGDCGAAYDADATCDAFSCTFGLCFCTGVSAVSDRRAELPVDLSGFGNLNISFNYIEGGAGTLDDASFEYFDGSAWTAVVLPKTANASCGGQGLWTNFSVALPAILYNNANARIGFRWVNNGDGAGADPSFAVDDILLTGDPVLESEAVTLHASPEKGGVQLSWEEESTDWKGSLPTLLHSYEGEDFQPLSQSVAGQFFHAAPRAGWHRYRLQWIGEQGQQEFGKIEAVNFTGSSIWAGDPFPVPIQDRLRIPLECSEGQLLEAKVLDLQGKIVFQQSQLVQPGKSTLNLELGDVAAGMYLLQLSHGEGRTVRRILLDQGLR